MRERADWTQTPWERNPLVLDAHVGAGTPYGTVGLALDYSLASWASVSAGAGVAHRDVLGGAMGRLRLPLGNIGLFIESGLSVGNYAASDAPLSRLGSDDDRNFRWSPAVWGHAGLGVEARVSERAQLRLYGGAAKILNEDSGTCEPGSSSDSPLCAGAPADVVEIPYIGLAFGYAL